MTYPMAYPMARANGLPYGGLIASQTQTQTQTQTSTSLTSIDGY